MLPEVSPSLHNQASEELQLGATAFSAHEVSPLPHPAFLWCGDVPELAGPEEEDQDSEEKCVRIIKKYTGVAIAFVFE